MSIDPKCVRALLLLLDERLAPTSSGKLPKPVKLKLVALDPPNGFAAEDVYAAGRYIFQKGFADLAVAPYVNVSRLDPRRYHFCSITAKGMDYLSVTRSEKLCDALIERFGNIFETAAGELVATAAKIGLQSLIG